MNAIQANLRRCGSKNSMTKLSNEQVMLMRRFRCEWARTPKYRELGRLFNCNEKYAQLICTGAIRIEAGGPTENPTRKIKRVEGDKECDEVSLGFAGYDMTLTIICEACRGKYHPAIENPKRCLRCHIYGCP